MVDKNISTANSGKKKLNAKKTTWTTAKFKWTEEMVQDLLDGLLEYKTQMEFNNSDINTDKNKQYEAVWGNFGFQVYCR